ncbi:hypothetical protein D3C85_1525870 [compost metagenome]
MFRIAPQNSDIIPVAKNMFVLAFGRFDDQIGDCMTIKLIKNAINSIALARAS